jgi:hypothetical protein
MNKAARIALQVTLGLVAVWLVYRISLFAMNKDKLSIETKEVDHKVQTYIVDGWTYMALMNQKQYNTIFKYASNYLPIRPSYNRKGGIQFTYSFWICMRNVDNARYAWRDIILKGDPESLTSYTVTRFHDSAYQDATTTKQYTETVRDVVAVKCPRIRFGPTYDSVQVELNTLVDPDARFLIRSFSESNAEGRSGGGMRSNAIKLVQDKWALMTFTFEDNVAINTHEDGIIIRFYLNDTLYASKTFKSAIRTNKSPLHLFPLGSAIADSRIGDVVYYNRALSHEEVAKVFDHGPPKKFADGSEIGNAVKLNEYNKADVYNT